MLTAWDVLQFLQDTYKCDQISIPLFSALTIFFSPLPSECTPHAAPGSLSAFPVLRSHLGPSHRPLSRFLGRDENTWSETGSSASQNSVSGWGYPSVRSACCYLRRRSGRQEVQRTDCGVGTKEESRTCQKHCSARRWNGWAPAAHRSRYASQGWAAVNPSGEEQKNTFQMARVKWLTRLPRLELPGSTSGSTLLPIKTLMAGVVMKCHLLWRKSLSVST